LVVAKEEIIENNLSPNQPYQRQLQRPHPTDDKINGFVLFLDGL
jgi:hypothetical protein